MDQNKNKGVYTREKDKALEEAARIADKIAKWKAEFEKVIPKAVVEEVAEIIEEGPTEEELKVIEDKLFAKNIAEAKAKADKVKELEKALAEAKEA